MSKKRLVQIGYGIAFFVVAMRFWLPWTLDPARHFAAPRDGDSMNGSEPQDVPLYPIEVGKTEYGDLEPHEMGSVNLVRRELPRSGDQTYQTFNALVLGLDHSGSRTDAIILANVNPAERKVILLSIPRDTMVPVLGLGMTKINHAHSWGQSQGGDHAGTETTVEAVEDLLTCDIRYYVKVDFEGYKHFIDTVGGVDVELPHEVAVNGLDMTFGAGKQHLDGEMALLLVRQRFTLPDGDFGRQRLQFLVLTALSQKLLQPEYIPKLPSLAVQVVRDVIDTNLSVTDALSLALLFQGMSNEDITYKQIPGSEKYAVDPLIKRELFYWVPDPEGIGVLSKLFTQ